MYKCVTPLPCAATTPALGRHTFYAVSIRRRGIVFEESAYAPVLRLARNLDLSGLEGSGKIDGHGQLAGGESIGEVAQVLAVVYHLPAGEHKRNNAGLAVGLLSHDVQDGQLLDGGTHGENVVVARLDDQVVEVGSANLLSEEEGVESSVALTTFG